MIRKEDMLINDGWGVKIIFIGMIWFGFCFSDDVCCYGYLVLFNMFVVVVLGYVEEIF